MRTLKRLILKARQLATDIARVIYDFNEDYFIEAIGLDPKDYEIELPDGTIAYDFDIVEGLNKIEPGLWDDDEE